MIPREILLPAVRATVQALQTASPGNSAAEAIQPLRDIGVTAGCGRKYFAGGATHPDESDETLYWYAGEIVDVIKARAWVAVNSIINCVDRFAPLPSKPSDVRQPGDKWWTWTKGSRVAAQTGRRADVNRGGGDSRN